MITRLPRWVWVGAWALAFVAGLVNAVGLMGFERQAITHLTGTTTMLGGAIAVMDGSSVIHFALLILAFLAGAALSGVLIEDTALKLGRRYPVALFLESAMLCAAVPLMRQHQEWGLYLASGACGLQNAMVTTYSGTVVRTTHVSGMFTDLGISLGHVLRRHPVDRNRLRLSAIVITGFLCGAVAGAASFLRLDYGALFIPAALTATAACACLWRGRKRRSS